MGLSDHQRRECMRIMHELMRKKISLMFSKPVDPVADNVPNYPAIVTNPMDLGTVKAKLIDNEYKNVDEWKSDVNLVWENTYAFHGKVSLIAALAKQLQTEFNQLTEFLSTNPTHDWAARFEHLREEIAKLSKAGPKPQKKKVLPQKKAAKQKPAPPPREIPQTYHRPVQPPIVQPVAFTDDEIVKLTNDVNALEDQAHVQAVIDLIRVHEPHLTLGEEVEIEVSKLHMSTLIELRKLVTKLLFNP